MWKYYSAILNLAAYNGLETAVQQLIERGADVNAATDDGYTGKSFSEALILNSTIPEYYKRLFIQSPVQYMKIPISEHGEKMGELGENMLLT